MFLRRAWSMILLLSLLSACSTPNPIVPSPSADTVRPSPYLTPTPAATPVVQEKPPLAATPDPSTDLNAFPSSMGFTVNFNREMDPDSVEKPLLTYPYLPGSLSWDGSHTSLTFQPETGFPAGKSYLAFLDHNLKSASGESFTSLQRWQIKTKTGPQVVSRTPSDSTLEDLRPKFILEFDRPMDQTSVARAFSIQPVAPYQLTWEKNSLKVSFDQPLNPGTYYSFTIGEDAADMQGAHLEEYRWSAWLPPFTVEKTAATTSALTVDFNYHLDMTGPNSNPPVSLAPPVDGQWSWTSATQLSFKPAGKLQYGTRYSLRFTGQLVDRNGDRLTLPDPVPFSVAPPVMLANPVTSSRYGDTVSQTEPIQIDFASDVSMDHARTQAAFHITPPLQGTFSWSKNRMTFQVDSSGFQENTQYTLQLDPTAVTVDGRPILVEPCVWSFHSGNYSYYNLDDLPLEFKDVGSAIQVVDANGRRAIQYVTRGYDDLPRFDLFKVDLAHFAQMYASRNSSPYAPPLKAGDLVGQAPIQTWWDPKPTTGSIETIIPQNVDPGLYVLQVTAVKSDSDQTEPRDWLFVVLSANTIMLKRSGSQVLAWVTDINGRSQSDLEVRLYSARGENLTGSRTDAEGIAHLTVPEGYTPMFVAARGPGEDVTIAGLEGDWQSGTSDWYWYGWGYYGSSSISSDRATTAYLYTDRPIYKPGQVVYFKGIFRKDLDARYRLLPEGEPVTFQVKDPRGNVIQTIDLALNTFGSADGEFTIAEGGMLGAYTLSAALQGETHTQGFKVEEYHKPDFQVSVSSDQDRAVVGETLTIDIDTRFFYGEPVPGAALTIREVPLMPVYDWWYGSTSGEPADYYWPANTGTHTVTADENGHYSYTLTAALDSDPYQWVSVWGASLQKSTWGIEVTADDGSHQTVNGSLTYTVYSASETITLDLANSVQYPGKPFTVRARVTTLDGAPVSGRVLTLEQQVYNSKSWEYETVTTSDPATTGMDGWSSFTISIDKQDWYQLRVSGQDAQQNEMHADHWLAVYSDYAFSSQPSGSTLKIRSEKDSYRPYDQAKVTIESSFSGPALLTFERGSVIRVKPIELTAPLTTVDLQIIPEDSPNVYVTVNAWRAMDTRPPQADASSSLYHNRPDSKLMTSSVELQVDTTDKALQVTITSDKSTYSPRQPATFTVSVRDAQGQPVSAEVSLALVDESVFSLSDDLSGSIFDAFYQARRKSVVTYDSMQPTRILDAGGGGGGGGGPASTASPRSDFQDTAAWFPALVTDQNGQVMVTINLPDNLTTWRLTARAATAGTLITRVGEAALKVITQQPVVVRPILPDVLTTGDRADLGAAIQNNAADPRSLVVSLRATNLLEAQTPPSQAISLQPGELKMLTWPVLAVQDGETQVTIEAVDGETVADAVQTQLTVRPRSMPDVITQTGDFTGEWSEILVMPEGALPSSKVQIRLSRSIADSILQGLGDLVGYPYGCVEQTMSKALPNAVVARLMLRLGIQDPDLQKKMPQLLTSGINKLYALQHDDGGWGWWNDDATDDYQSAWVVFGLATTAEAGASVDPQVIQRGIAYLQSHLEEMDPRTRAFALYALASAGQPDRPASLALSSQAAGSLDAFSQAALALALDKAGAADQAHALIDLLIDSAYEQNGLVSWPMPAGDGEYHQKTMASTTRSTALVLQALLEIAPESDLITGAVRFLMNRRQNFGWGTTNETSFTILALTRVLEREKEDLRVTEYTVTLDGQVVANGKLASGEIVQDIEMTAAQLKPGINHLHIATVESGKLYYVLTSRMNLDEPKIQPAGIVEISREYISQGTTGNIFHAGDIIRVELNIKLSQPGTYLLLEDSLPGGFEALNERLNTSSYQVKEEQDERAITYWQEYGYNQKEIRPGKVSFFITWASDYSFTVTYLARAVQTGTFVALPAEVSAMYDTDIWGRSGSDALTIDVKPETDSSVQRELPSSSAKGDQ